MAKSNRYWRIFYDHIAFVYDAVLQAGAWLHISSETRIRREVILKLPAFENVIEIGCGTGSNRQFLPSINRYVGVDISRGMLTRARKKCAVLGLTADFVQADATALPFRSGYADLVLAMGTLQYLAFPGEVINQMALLVKTGGEILIIDERRSQKRILQNTKHYNVLPEPLGEYFILKYPNNPL
jgi:ubiquinone/menaquinone biosynthesis C-methylase UbiE